MPELGLKRGLSGGPGRRARTRRRSRRWSIRPRPPRISGAWRERAPTGRRLLRGARLHAARDATSRRRRPPRRRVVPGACRCGRTSRTTRAWPWWRSPTRVLDAPAWCAASTPIRASRPPSSCSRSGCRASCPSRRPRPIEVTRVAPPIPAARSAALPDAAHAYPHARVPVERPLRHGRHERRRRLQRVPRARGHAAARGRGRAIRAASTSICATCAAARSGRRPISRRASEPERIPDHVPRRQGGVPAARRRDRNPARDRGLARGRRRGAAAVAHEPQRAPCARSRSRATSRWRWRRPAEDLAHPAFGKLFLETECRPETASLLCGRRPRSAEEPGAWAVHVLSMEGRTQSAVEWETDRVRFLGRGRGLEDPDRARRPARCSGTTGATLDPMLSLRQRIRLAPGGFARLAFATGMAADREAAIALCMKYADPTSAPRTFALAAHAARDRAPPSRHPAGGGAALRAPRLARLLRRPLAGAPIPTRSRAQRRSASRGCGATASRATCRSCSCACSRPNDLAARAPGAAGAGLLAAQGPERRRRDPERAPGQLSRRDARAARTRCSRAGRGARGRTGRAARSCSAARA